MPSDMTAHATVMVESGHGSWQPWPRLEVRVPPEMFEAIKERATSEGRTMAAIVRNAAGQALGVEVDDPRSYGQSRSKDNGETSRRKTLSANVASALLEAHHRTKATFQETADALGIDVGMWWRLLHSQRAPSRATAERIIRGLDLPNHVAEALLGEAVPPKTWPE